MSRFTTIFWDLDGTLLDFFYSQKAAVQKVAVKYFGYEFTEAQVQIYSEINDSFWKKLEKGEISKTDLYVARFIEFFEKMRITSVNPADFARDYEDELGKVVKVADGAFAVVETLKNRYKQYVVTNGDSHNQKNKMRLSGLETLVDGVFISDDIGVPKPQAAFFDYCLAHIEEEDRNAILVVGDSLSSDIKGAVISGIPSCWYAPVDMLNTTEYKETYRISNLEELFQIFEDD